MRHAALYLVMVLLTVYVEIMYTDFYGITLLAFEILLFVSMFLLSWYLKRAVRARIETKTPSVRKDEEITVELKVRNKGFLPVTKLVFQVAAKPSGLEGRTKVPVTAHVPARKESRTLCTAFAQYCGRYCFFVAKGSVWDYLGLTSRRIRCEGEACVNVQPGFYRMEVKVSERTANFPADGEEYDPHKSGDDPSEIFQVREFREGDTLQRVHWKLSAKSDRLMTKELGHPIGYRVLVLVDLYMGKEEKNRLQKTDVVFELAAAASFSLQQAGVCHLVVWFDKKQGGIYRTGIQKEEQVYEMADRMLAAEPYFEEISLWQIYGEEYPGERFSSILRIDAGAALFVNGVQTAVFEPEHLEEQIGGCLLEV